MTPIEVVSGLPPTLVEMGDAIRTIRGEKDISLRDAASASGMRVPQVTQVERGERQPSNAELHALLSKFGLTGDEFVLRLSSGAKTLAEEILSATGPEPDPTTPTAAAVLTPSAGDAPIQPQVDAPRPVWGKSLKGEPNYFQVRACVPCIFKRAQEHAGKQEKKKASAKGTSDNEIVFEWTSPSGIVVQVYSAIDRYTGTVRTRYGFISEKPHVIRIRLRDMNSNQYIRPWAARVTLDGDWPRPLMAELGAALALAGDRPKCPKCSKPTAIVESKGSTSWRCAGCKHALPLRKPHTLGYFPIRARRLRRRSPGGKPSQQAAALPGAAVVAEEPGPQGAPAAA